MPSTLLLPHKEIEDLFVFLLTVGIPGLGVIYVFGSVIVT